MFPYRVKYNASEYDIQNNDLLFKIDQQCQNTFEILKSKSIVYPPQQTRTDVSGHAIESLNRCASFITNILFSYVYYIYSYIYIYTYLYLYIYIFIHIYISIYIYIYRYINIYKYINIYV